MVLAIGLRSARSAIATTSISINNIDCLLYMYLVTFSQESIFEPPIG